MAHETATVTQFREILFRGKNYDGKWETGFGVFVDGHFGAWLMQTNPKYNIAALVYSRGVNFRTIGQFTGLTDKNGKKMFEGDIYRVINKGKTLETLFEIRFLHGAFCAAPVRRDDEDFVPLEWIGNEDEPDDSAYFYDYAAHGLQFEVVGNIYDDPELLKAEDVHEA